MNRQTQTKRGLESWFEAFFSSRFFRVRLNESRTKGCVQFLNYITFLYAVCQIKYVDCDKHKRIWYGSIFTGIMESALKAIIVSQNTTYYTNITLFTLINLKCTYSVILPNRNTYFQVLLKNWESFYICLKTIGG